MNVRKELEAKGCIYKGHFVGVSTKHLSGYCNIDPLLPHATLVSKLIKELVGIFKDDGVETVAAPAVGAIPFAHWGVHHLHKTTGREIYGVWADKVSGAPTREFVFEREGFTKYVKGKKVLILEDMINQMTSIKAMIKTVREAGGKIIGVGAIAANKGVDAIALDIPKFAKLCSVEYDAWTADDCAKFGLCAQAVPIVTDIGHGDDFQKANPQYDGGYVNLLNS
jgi:orotate phosphoribosyltransferase